MRILHAEVGVESRAGDALSWKHHNPSGRIVESQRDWGSCRRIQGNGERPLTR